MRGNCPLAAMLLTVALLPLAGGCRNSGGEGDAKHDSAAGGGHGHSHDDVGPHEGHLIEVGEEEYHVEWVHDDEEGTITFYLLDGNAKEEVPIAARDFVLELVNEEEPSAEPLRPMLTAVGASGDEGKTAQFELTDRIAVQSILAGSDKVTARLRLTIDGVPYKEKIKHDAHGHSHAH